MTVLRRAYVEVEPDVSGFDSKLKEKFSRTDPGGKAGKQLGGQLNRALKKLDLEAVDVKADPKKALAAIAVTERQLQALSKNASTIEIRVRAEQGLKEIARFRKTLGDAGGDAAPEISLSLSQKLGPLLAKLPISGPMGAGLAAAAASAAPLLGAAVAGGIIGGVGVGGIIGGVTLAAKDTRVKAAADILGDRLESRLNRAAGAFVGPTIKALGQIQQTVDDIDLEGLFGDSAKLLPTLANGASSAIADIGHALTELVDNAGPPVEAISNGIALIGDRAAKGLASLSDNAEGSADALRTVFEIVGYGITSTLGLVNVLTELYEINKALGGDLLLQVALKATGASLDQTGFSARRTAEGVNVLDGAQITAAVSAEELKKQQEALKAVQDRVKVSQDALGATLDSLGGKSGFATRASDALRTAMDNLYGATIRQTDANQSYEASWDGLSASVKANKGSLDVHTEAGRANRDALKALIGTTNEAYIADVNAGVAIEKARQKHDNRIKSIEKESVKLGLNSGKTRELIDTYGDIPPNKTTDLVLDGVREVVQQLKNLYIYQRSLATGKSIESIEQTMRTGSDRGPAKRGGGFREGGRTGNMPEHAVAGVVHGREAVFPAPTVRRIDQQSPGFIDEVLATGQLPGYRTGGRVAPVDTSRRWPFVADMSGTYIPSRAKVASKVAIAPGAFGAWPSSPSAQRGDSGVWKQVAALIRSTGPLSGSFGNGYRPGDPLWHGSGRAVDWMGFNQDALASFLAARRPLELIHRTGKRDYAYTRGKDKGSFSNGLMEAHRNHIHIAMDDGGFRMLQPGMNLIPNGTGKPELIGGPKAMSQVAGGTTIVINIPPGAVIASKRAAEDLLVEAYKSAKAGRRIP
jgi:hypothetical protein